MIMIVYDFPLAFIVTFDFIAELFTCSIFGWIAAAITFCFLLFYVYKLIGGYNR